MKKFLNLLLLVFSFSVVNVYANNTVDYHLTITEDYRFQEVITYSITDYKQVENADNHFADIINDDVYTDILGKTKYSKNVTKQSGKYIVTLSHVYSELTYSNANFMNNCFQRPEFVYDVDKYVFTSSGDFNCYYGDSLKITVTTDKTVTKTNATKTGNNYVWFPPTSGPFNMQFQITKTYDSVEPTTEEEEIYDDVDQNGLDTGNGEKPKDSNSEEDSDTEDEVSDDEEVTESNKKSSNPYLLIITSGVVFGALIFVIITLKIKKDRINRL